MDHQRAAGSLKRSSMKTHLCLPRLNRGGGSGAGANSFALKSHRLLSPMTLLERFREAVFRLMMLSALSKFNSSTNVTTSEDDNINVVLTTKRPYSSSYNPADQYHTEAVADCIEFIKRSSTLNDKEEEDEDEEEKEDQGHRRGSGGGGGVDLSTTNPEMVLPVPVI